MGDAALGGQIEISRDQIYASYPDADKARTDAYFSYMFCIVLFDPGNKQSPEEKQKAITEFRRQLQSGSSSTEEQPDRNQSAVLEYVYSELDKTTRNLLGLVSQIVVYSTDGWLPQNENEFFSSRVATLICSRLNIDSLAVPVVPNRDWLIWIHENTYKAAEELNEVLKNYATALPAELLRKVAKVKNSFFLTFPGKWLASRSYDRQMGFQRPPLLCSGAESLMEKSLIELRELYDQVWIVTGREKRFPMPSQGRNLEKRIGKSRFSEEDMKRWIAEHPYAPSGKPPKSSNQN